MRTRLLALLLLCLVSAACTESPPPVAPTLTPFSTPVEPLSLPPLPTRPPCDLKEVNLGAVISLSGSASVYGEAIKQGAELAVEEINEQHFIGQEAEIHLQIEDDESDKEVAADVFRRLIEADEVVAILGPTLSNSAFEADPLSEAAGIPTLGTSNTAAGITEMGAYIFRNSLPEASVIPNTISRARAELNFDSVVLLYGEDDRFTESGFQVMQQAAEEEGLEILGVERFVKGDRDFTEQLTRVKELNPDILFVSALVEEAAALLKQAREMGIDTPVIGGNGFNSPGLLTQAGDAAEGVVVGSAWFINNPLPENLAFIESYREKFGSDPDQFAAQAYTGVWLYGHALRETCSTNRKLLRDALAALRQIPTPLGSFSFTGERNPLHPPVILTIEDGKFTIYDPDR